MRFITTVSMLALLAFAAPSFAEDEYVIMKVSGQDVSSAEVQHMWEGLFPAGQVPAFETTKPEMRDRILRALMAEKILYGEAVKQGVDKSPKLLADLEDVRKKLIVRSYLDSKSADLITDSDLKKEYDVMVSAMKDEKQIHARHILLATEEEAKDVKKKLDAGKKFEEMARDYSKDPGSAKNGGDLGNFTRDKMVKEFADAAFAMKKGEISGPVKSGFGYHIIKIEEISKVTPPTYNEVKDQLRGKLQEKKLNDFISGLVKSADVKVFDPKGKELKFDRNLIPLSDKSAKLADEPKTEKTEKIEKPEKADKSEKSDKPTKSEKADKPADNADKANKPH